MEEVDWKERGDEYKYHGPSSRHTRRLIKKYMTAIKFNSIIDIGCGTGVLLSELNLEDKQIMGIDISKEGIKQCKKKLPDAYFKVCDISKNIPFGKIDLGICSEVLEHIDQDLKSLMHIKRMCDKVIITVPSGRYTTCDIDNGHHRRYTKKSIKNLLKFAGFHVLMIEEWGFPFYSPIYRFFLDRTTVKQRSGKVTKIKRIISELLYHLFFLNIPGKGDRIIVLAKALPE